MNAIFGSIFHPKPFQMYNIKFSRFFHGDLGWINCFHLHRTCWCSAQQQTQTNIFSGFFSFFSSCFVLECWCYVNLTPLITCSRLITEVNQWDLGLYWSGTPSIVVHGPCWCQIHPHGGFCCLHGPRVKPIMTQGSRAGGVLWVVYAHWRGMMGSKWTPFPLYSKHPPLHRDCCWVGPHTHMQS